MPATKPTPAADGMDAAGRAHFEEVLVRIERRTSDWERFAAELPPAGPELQKFIGMAAPRAVDAFHETLIVEWLYDVFALAYAAPDLTAAQWKDERIVRYLRYAFLDGLVLLRSASILCEQGGIPSTRLTQIAARWGRHWRECKEPRTALIKLEKSIGHEELLAAFAETTARLLRLREPESKAIQERLIAGLPPSLNTEQDSEPKPGRPVRRRDREPAPDGWIYLVEAEEKYPVSGSSLHEWTAGWPSEDRKKHPENGQVLVVESKLLELLRKKGKLKP
jgi:hypothetical protein